MPRFDETGKAIDKASRTKRTERKAEGVAEERLGFVAVKPQDVADKLEPFDGTAIFAQHGHLSLKAKLQRHHPYDAHHEAVERADQREVLTRDDLAEHCGKVAAGEVEAKAFGFLLRFVIVGGRIREALYEAVEYLACRKAREREGDNPLRLDPAEDESKKARDKRERLACAGGSLDDGARRKRHSCASLRAA